jgi:spore germination protein KA
VPLPAAIECLLLLIMFDILRETGVRMPLGVGQALNIVGALVVGSAAVEADLVSAPMIIVTAVSGITSLLIPKMNASAIPIRLIFLLMASCFGFYGLMLGFSVLLIHILSLESFGVSQFTQDKPYRFQRVKDTFIRAPWPQMLTRPWAISDNKTRQNPTGRNV